MHELILGKKPSMEEFSTALESVPRDTTSLYVNSVLRAREVIEILNRLPFLKELFLPPSLLPLTPKPVKDALEDSGVRVGFLRKKRGRPFKLSERLQSLIRGSFSSGLTAREISEKHGVPLRTVYWHLRRQVFSPQKAKRGKEAFSGPNRI
ncbi:MAG TPA: hypothetical protein VJA40_00165 [archaeon]|nr:hypothetical protein [archaeon]